MATMLNRQLSSSSVPLLAADCKRLSSNKDKASQGPRSCASSSRTSVKNDLSKLPPCLQLLHERRRRAAITSTSCSSASSSPRSAVLPPAFQSCLQRKSAQQSIWKDLNSSSHHNHNTNGAPPHHGPPSPLRRIQRNLSLKRAAWRQVALRERQGTKAATLHVLKAAALQANGQGVKALLEEAAKVVYKNRTSDGAETLCSRRQRKTKAAVCLQRCFRRCSHRRRRISRRNNSREQTPPRSTSYMLNRSSVPAGLSAPCSPAFLRGRLERNPSELTMSEFGDSLHQTLHSIKSKASDHHPKSSRLGGDTVHSSTACNAGASGSIYYETDSFESLTELCDSPKTSMIQRNSAAQSNLNHEYQMRDAMAQCRSPLSPLPVALDTASAARTPEGGLIPVASLWGHISCSSYFDPHERYSSVDSMMDTPVRHPQRCLSPKAPSSAPPAFSDDQELRSLIGMAPIPPPLFQESKASLNFPLFEHSRDENEGDTTNTCATLRSSVSSSRWDDSAQLLNFPGADSNPAIVGSSLPAQPPMRKLSPMVGILSTAGRKEADVPPRIKCRPSPETSTPSPTLGRKTMSTKTRRPPEDAPNLPLRKSSTHGTSHELTASPLSYAPRMGNDNDIPLPSPAPATTDQPDSPLPRMPRRQVSMTQRTSHVTTAERYSPDRDNAMVQEGIPKRPTRHPSKESSGTLDTTTGRSSGGIPSMTSGPTSLGDSHQKNDYPRLPGGKPSSSPTTTTATTDSNKWLRLLQKQQRQEGASCVGVVPPVYKQLTIPPPLPPSVHEEFIPLVVSSSTEKYDDGLLDNLMIQLSGITDDHSDVSSLTNCSMSSTTLGSASLCWKEINNHSKHSIPEDRRRGVSKKPQRNDDSTKNATTPTTIQERLHLPPPTPASSKCLVETKKTLERNSLLAVQEEDDPELVRSSRGQRSASTGSFRQLELEAHARAPSFSSQNSVSLSQNSSGAESTSPRSVLDMVTSRAELAKQRRHLNLWQEAHEEVSGRMIEEKNDQTT